MGRRQGPQRACENVARSIPGVERERSDRPTIIHPNEFRKAWWRFLMRLKPILVCAAGAALLAAGGFALVKADSGTPSLGPQSVGSASSLNLACPHYLGNIGGGAASKTARCGSDTSTTAAPTTTTTVAPTPTTTVPQAPTPTAPTATAAPPPATVAQAGGGICTNPSFSTSDAMGAVNTDPSDGSQNWWVDNDAWSGSHGPQTLNVCNQASWYAVSNQPDVGGQVETYANTEYDVGGRSTGTTTPISSWNSITSTYAEAFPSAGAWDAGLRPLAQQLVHRDHGLEPVGRSTGVLAVPGDHGPDARWCAVPLLRQWRRADVLPGHADLVGVGGHPRRIQWLVSQGLVKSTDVPTQLEYGVEVCNSGGELMFFRDAQTSSGSVDILAALQWLVSQGLVKSTDVPERSSSTGSRCAPRRRRDVPAHGVVVQPELEQRLRAPEIRHPA